jgi:hypothetical protein
VAIVATPKSPVADVWGTLAEADAYHANRLHNSEWTTATDATKETALKWSALLLNKLNWDGERTTEAQAQSQPRAYLHDRDGWYIDSEVVYKDMKDASFEFAWLLIKGDSTKESDTVGFSKIKVAVIELTIDKTDKAKKIPTSVTDMVKPWLIGFGTTSVGKG